MAKKNSEDYEPALPPDGGWGWAVMIASFFSNMIVDGVLYTFGIFLVYLVIAFPEAGNAQISLVGSLLGGTYLIVGPFVAALANKFGCRPVAITGAIISCISFIISTFSTNITMLLITYGICGGIGFGLLYLPSIVIVGLYFDRKRALATGIAVCGSGLGTFIFAPLASLLCDHYGWKGANLIIAAIILNGIACGLVYLPLIKRKKKHDNNVDEIKTIGNQTEVLIDNTGIEAGVEIKPFSRSDVLYGGSVQNLAEYKNCDNDMKKYVESVTDVQKVGTDENCCVPAMRVITKMFDFSLLLSPTFLIICMTGVLGFMGFFSPFVYLTSYALTIEGVTPGQASLLVSAIGLSNTISRIIAGIIADRPWADSVHIHTFALILAGISTCMLPLFSNYALIMAYAIVFGFSIAAFIALRSIVICDLLGVQKLTNAFGLMALFQGIALLLGTPVSGAIYDSTGSYSLSFVVAGVMMIMGGVICLPVRFVHRWETARNENRKKKKVPTATLR